MNIQADTDSQSLTITAQGESRTIPLYSREGFELLSDLWVKVGWQMRYSYTFSWMGRPLIQLPEDLIRIQEVIFDLKPDFIVETGVAHGGSLIFYSSLFEAMGHGQVIGIDIEIRPVNRAAIEAHLLQLTPLSSSSRPASSRLAESDARNP
jgi:cephalosporin hydroxylase